jgi:hypothetical protein
MQKALNIILNKEGLYPGDLKPYFRAVWNASNVNLPYHNLQHMLAVTCSVYEGCKFYDISGVHMRNLLIAALFHDYNHTGLVGDDEVNIKIAVEGLKKHILLEDSDSLITIVSYILATQFPHKEGYDNLLMQIIRDADITYTMTEDWIQIILQLGVEFNLTPNQMLMGQIPFIQNTLKLSSEWAINNYSEKIQERIEEINLIIETLMS